MLTRTTRQLLAATLVTAAALGGCRDSVGFDPPETGQVLFTYEGAHSGTFSADGVLPEAPFWSDSYAAAYRAVEARGNAPRQEYFVLVANSPSEEETQTDFFSLILERPAAGTYACEVDDEEICRYSVLMIPHLDPGNPTAAPTFFGTSGTLEVLTMTSTRATGTFTLVLENPAAETTEEITISGSFDVPIVPAHYLR